MSVKGFALWAAFWLPITFGGWYFSSILFVMPLADILSLLSTTLLPQLISSESHSVAADLIGHTLCNAHGRSHQTIAAVRDRRAFGTVQRPPPDTNSSSHLKVNTILHAFNPAMEKLPDPVTLNG